MIKYLAFLDGKYSVAPALQPLKKVEQPYDKLVFQIDEEYNRYIDNKLCCRKESIQKYYTQKNLTDSTAARVNQFIVQQLVNEHPAFFELKPGSDIYLLENKKTGECLRWKEDWIKIEDNIYLSLFDALACQVQEDFAICQLEGDKDMMVAIHVCSANHWAPVEKVGKPFDSIHAVVPGMEKAMPHYFKMLVSAVNKGPFTRFAWGISTDKRLNHHPVAPVGINSAEWYGRKIEEGCDLYVRVEKQTINGLPDVNAFFFTIRSYFYPVDELKIEEKEALVLAIESMSEQSLLYKGMSGKVEVLRKMMA